MTTIQTVDLASAAEQLREKIKLSFVELIPQAQWDAMIQTEVTKFMQPVEQKDYYGRVTGHTTSQFSALCQKILEAQLKEELEKRVKDTKQHPKYFPDANTLLKLIEQWLDANYDKIMREFFGSVFGGAVKTAIEVMIGKIKPDAIY